MDHIHMDLNIEEGLYFVAKFLLQNGIYSCRSPSGSHFTGKQFVCHPFLYQLVTCQRYSAIVCLFHLRRKWVSSCIHEQTGYTGWLAVVYIIIYWQLQLVAYSRLIIWYVQNVLLKRLALQERWGGAGGLGYLYFLLVLILMFCNKLGHSFNLIKLIVSH